MSNNEEKRKLRNLKNVLTRRARYVPVAKAYRCAGGPFDNKVLYLQTGSTCHLVIGDWRGRYAQNNHWGHGLTVAWEADNATH